MTYYYQDTDVGLDTNDGTTWETGSAPVGPKLTFEGLIAVMSAGDIGVVHYV